MELTDASDQDVHKGLVTDARFFSHRLKQKDLFVCY